MGVLVTGNVRPPLAILISNSRRAKVVLGKEVVYMRCEYNDGLKVNYSGSLLITKGDEVNVFLNEDEIPVTIKDELLEASLHDSRSELRHVAQEVTDILGSNIPK